MSCLTFSLFDERRTGIAFDLIQRNEPSPFDYSQDDGPPFWFNTLPRTLIDRVLQTRSETIPSNSNRKLGYFKKYYALLDQLKYEILDNPDIVHAKSGIKKEEGSHLCSWTQLETNVVLYNLGILLGRAANAGRFNYQASPSPLAHNQQSFEEAAGIFDVLASLLEDQPESGIPELDPAYLRCLMKLFLGCSQEALLVLLVAEDSDNKAAAKVASCLATHFGEAHNALLAIQRKGLETIKHVLLNVAIIKFHFYTALAQLFFNPTNPGRRNTAIQSLSGAMQNVVKFFVENRHAAATELRSFVEEAQNHGIYQRWVGTTVPQVSRQRPAPRVPRWLKAIHMFNYWKSWCRHRKEGLEPDSTDHVADEDDDEVEIRKRKKVAAFQKSRSAVKTGELPAVSCKLTVPHCDLKNKLVADGAGCNSSNVLLSLTTPRPPNRDGNSAVSLSLVLVVDCCGAVNMGASEPHKANVVKEMLQTLIYQCGFTDNDFVGIVTFTGLQGVACNLHRMDQEGKKNVVDVIGGLRATGGNTSVTTGVMVGIETLLRHQFETSSYELLLLTDGHDCDNLGAAWNNWSSFYPLINKLQGMTKSDRLVRVHGFAIGDESDKYLVEGIARKGGGEFTFAPATAQGVSVIKQWFLNHIANQFTTVASNVRLNISCAEGVVIRQLGVPRSMVRAQYSPSDVSRAQELNKIENFALDMPVVGHVPKHQGLSDLPTDLNFLHDFLLHTNPTTIHRTDASFAEIVLDDISYGHSNNIVIAFGVYPAGIHTLSKDLASISLSYTDAHTKQRVEVTTSPTLLTNNVLLDRLRHSWLEQAFIADLSADVAVTAANIDDQWYPNAGDWLDAMDKVVVSGNGGGTLVLTVPDSSKLEFGEGSAFVLKTVDTPHLTSQWAVQNGKLWVTTGARCSAEVEFGPYHVVFKGETRASACYRNGNLEMTCMTGSVAIAGEGFPPFTLLPHKQTIARDRGAPVPAWAIDEIAVTDWIKRDMFLRATIEVEAHVVRVIAAQSMLKASDLLKKVSRRELTSNRKCREFLIAHWLKNAKMYLNNSYAAETTLVNKVRKLLDYAIANAIKSPPPEDRELTVRMDDGSATLLHERALGACEEYLTPFQEEFLQLYTTRIAKLTAEANRQTAELLAEDAQLERRRREQQVHLLFPKWDLDGSGSIEFPELQQVILNFSAGAGYPIPLSFLKRWQELVRDELIDMQLDQRKLATLVLYLCEECDGAAFDSVVSKIESVLSELGEANERSRQARSVWNLFQIWDREARGFVDTAEILQAMLQVKAVRDCGAIPRLRNALHLGEGTLRPDQEIVHLNQFHHLMEFVFGQLPEPDFHEVLMQIRMQVEKGERGYSNVQHASKATSREDERSKVLQNEMRHVFDGVTSKDIVRFLNDQQPPPPAMQQVAKPVGVFMGLVPKRRVTAKISSAEDDWLTPLREHLAQDVDGCINFLMSFPVMSLTYKQVASVMPIIESPEFDSNLVLRFSPLLAALVGWVKVILKLALIDNDWTFTRPPEPAIPKHPVEKLDPELMLSSERARSPRPKSALASKLSPRYSELAVPQPDPYMDRMKMLARLGGGRLQLSASTNTPLSHAAPHAHLVKHPNLTPNWTQRPSSARAARPLHSLSPEQQLEFDRLSTAVPTTPPPQTLPVRPTTASPRRLFLTPESVIRPSTGPAKSTQPTPPAADAAFAAPPVRRAVRTDAQSANASSPLKATSAGLSQVQLFLEYNELGEYASALQRHGCADLIDLAAFVAENQTAFETIIPLAANRRKLLRLLREEGF